MVRPRKLEPVRPQLDLAARHLRQTIRAFEAIIATLDVRDEAAWKLAHNTLYSLREFVLDTRRAADAANPPGRDTA